MLKKILTFSLMAFYCLVIQAQKSTCNESESNSLSNNLSKCLNSESTNRSIQVTRRTDNFLRNKIISTNNFKEKTKTKYSLNDLVKEKKHAVKNIPLFTSCKEVTNLDNNACLTSSLVAHLNSNLTSRTKKLKDDINLKFTLDRYDEITGIDIVVYYKDEGYKEQTLETIAKLPKFIKGAEASKYIKLNYFNAVEKNNLRVKSKAVNNRAGIMNFREGAVVEKVPQFKSCQKVAIYQQQKCFKGKMVEYLNENNSKHSRMSKITDTNISDLKFIIDENQKLKALSISFNKENVVVYNKIMKTITKLPKFIEGNELNDVITINYK